MIQKSIHTNAAVCLAKRTLWGKWPTVDTSSKELALLNSVFLCLKLIHIPVGPDRPTV
jgi:hypothetical protein